MSIESFIERYPADDGFPIEMSVDHNSHYTSPVDFMANIYIQEGGEGLWNATDSYIRAKSNGEEIMAEVALDRVYLNHHAINLGLSIRAIRDMLNSGEFDQNLFNQKVISAFTGTGQEPLLIENPRIETIPFYNFKKMKKVLQGDGTYGDFFGSEFESLPKSLKKYLRDFKFDEYKDRILPDFIVRTSLLISAQSSSRH